MIKLGDRVRDIITGFEGIAIGRSLWLYGCERIGIEPTELHDGRPQEPVFFDEQRVAVVTSGPDTSAAPETPAPQAEKPVGGPRNDDRGGTASSFRGHHGSGWYSRRDC